MNYLALVNAVLKRLRVSEVSSVASGNYPKLIGELVNQAKREVEDAFTWTALQDEKTFSTTASTEDYTITGLGERGRIYQVHDTTTRGSVRAVSQMQANRWADFPGTTTGPPQYWRIWGQVSGDPVMRLWPIPDGIYNISVYTICPQADLALDSTEMTVPSWPVILGAYSLAISERGDDGGQLMDETRTHYMSALNDAIAINNLNDNAGRSTDWHVA